jgi:hypothetical protein
MVNIRLHHRGVNPQLAATGHLQRTGQLDHAVVERGDRVGTNEVGPADEGGVVGHRLEIEAAELAQYQAVAHEALSLLVAPVVQALDDQEPQDDLDRGGMAPARRGVRPAPHQVGAYSLEQRVVIQQLIELREFGVERQLQLGHQGAEILRRVAIPQHRTPPGHAHIVTPSAAGSLPQQGKSPPFRTAN